MKYFRWKLRLVACVNVTDPPATMFYTSVVYQETVHISLTIFVMNYLQVKSDDIHNDYIQAPVVKKIWTVLVADFVFNVSKIDIIVRALYVIKSVGACFWNRLEDCIKYLGYVSCSADPYLWMHSMVRTINGN